MDRRSFAALSFYFPKMEIDDFATLISGETVDKDSLLQRFLAEKPDAFRRIEKDLAALASLGAKVTVPGDDDYPRQFFASLHPPVILTYLGEPVWRNRQLLAVVGSREPARESLDWMDRHLAPIVQKHRIVTVSGGAYGIDQKAHSISMRLEIPTVVFLPSGLLKIYPDELKAWIATIVAQGGAVISEFAPSSPMFRSHFFRRNRMIGSLSESLLVVEARRQGGSMMTAQWALKQGKTVASIPAFPDDERYAGNNLLIRDGATVILSQLELLKLIGQ